MSDSFKINDGKDIESHKLNDLNSVLQKLPDNTQKLIKPKDVRNAFLTVWSESAFKLTNSGSIDYIGIDSGDPMNRDRKRKILLGKRMVQNYNVMNTSLLNNNTDIFFYNTKSDNDNQDSTKISFLAGNQISLFNTAPYIESKYNGSRIEFNIINPQQSINILSKKSTVSINGIEFPKVGLTVSEGQTLIYRKGKLEWGDLDITSFNMGGNDSEFNIVGPTVSLNGYNLEFVDDRKVPNNIGGIEKGMSFSSGSYIGNTYSSNWPIVEVIRELLYPDIDPEIEFINDYIKIVDVTDNSVQTVNFDVKIITYPKIVDEENGTYSIFNDQNINVIDYNFNNVNNVGYFSGTFNFIHSGTGSYTFSAYVIDDDGKHSYSENFYEIKSVAPIFYGIDSLTTSNISLLNREIIDMDVKRMISKTYVPNNEHIIFACDSNYKLENILQNNFFDLLSQFETYTYSISNIVYDVYYSENKLTFNDGIKLTFNW